MSLYSVAGFLATQHHVLAVFALERAAMAKTFFAHDVLVITSVQVLYTKYAQLCMQI